MYTSSNYGTAGSQNSRTCPCRDPYLILEKVYTRNLPIQRSRTKWNSDAGSDANDLCLEDPPGSVGSNTTSGYKDIKSMMTRRVGREGD